MQAKNDTFVNLEPIDRIATSLLKELILMSTAYELVKDENGKYKPRIIRIKRDGSTFCSERIYRILSFYGLYCEVYPRALEEMYMIESIDVNDLNRPLSINIQSAGYKIFKRLIEACLLERKMYDNVCGKTSSAPYRALFYYFCGKPTYDDKPDDTFPYIQNRANILNKYLNLEIRRFYAENKDIEDIKRVK